MLTIIAGIAAGAALLGVLGTLARASYISPFMAGMIGLKFALFVATPMHFTVGIVVFFYVSALIAQADSEVLTGGMNFSSALNSIYVQAAEVKADLRTFKSIVFLVFCFIPIPYPGFNMGALGYMAFFIIAFLMHGAESLVYGDMSFRTYILLASAQYFGMLICLSLPWVQGTNAIFAILASITIPNLVNPQAMKDIEIFEMKDCQSPARIPSIMGLILTFVGAWQAPGHGGSASVAVMRYSGNTRRLMQVFVESALEGMVVNSFWTGRHSTKTPLGDILVTNEVGLDRVDEPGEVVFWMMMGAVMGCMVHSLFPRIPVATPYIMAAVLLVQALFTVGPVALMFVAVGFANQWLRTRFVPDGAPAIGTLGLLAQL